MPDQPERCWVDPKRTRVEKEKSRKKPRKPSERRPRFESGASSRAPKRRSRAGTRARPTGLENDAPNPGNSAIARAAASGPSGECRRRAGSRLGARAGSRVGTRASSKERRYEPRESGFRAIYQSLKTARLIYPIKRKNFTGAGSTQLQNCRVVEMMTD